MKLIEPIINTALLGTGTQEYIPGSLAAPLDDVFRKIRESGADKESAFYQMSAIAFAYHNAGMEAASDDGVHAVEESPEETLPYLPKAAGELLRTLVVNKYNYLLIYAYRRWDNLGRIIPPFYLPELISHACVSNNPNRSKEQELLSRLSGRRGEWLARLMGLSLSGEKEPTEWDTASHEERKMMLLRMRERVPSEGLALLGSELKNEPAARRDELIQCLKVNLSKDDEPFLQEIAKSDRSAVVRTTALRLLSKLPDSELVKRYCSLLEGNIKWRMLMGWSYGTISYTPEMKSLGLEEVSPNKGEKDSDYLLRQLAERVPLSFWAKLYDCTPEKAAAKLAARPPFGKYFDVCSAIETFKDRMWAFQTLKDSPEEYRCVRLMGLLSPQQREEIKFTLNERGLDIPSSWFNEDGEEWGVKFSTRILQHVVRSRFYYFDKDMVERLALRMPQSLRREVERYASEYDEQQMLSKFFRMLNEYMIIKGQINTLLNDNIL